MSSHTNQAQMDADDEAHEELQDMLVLQLRRTCRGKNNEEDIKEDEKWLAERKELRAAITVLKAVCRGNTENIKQEDFEKAQSVFMNSVTGLRDRCAPPAQGSKEEIREGPNAVLFSQLEESIHGLTGTMLKFMDTFPLTLNKARE